MILNDKQIIKLAEEHEMISPFVNKSVANGISHGVNPFGYDLRCGSEFKIFTNIKELLQIQKISVKIILLQSKTRSLF